MSFDHDDVILVMDNHQYAYERAREIAEEVLGEDYEGEKVSWTTAREAGDKIRDFVSEEFGPLASSYDSLSGLLVSQMMGSIDWVEVGRHYCDDVLEERQS